MDQVLSGKEAVRPSESRVRRKFTLAQKRGFIEEAGQVGSSISIVSRRYGLSPSQLFQWRRMMEEGALAGLNSGEQVVPASQVRELRAKVRELERLLGRKTVEVEILKEAVELAREKKLISRAPLQGVGSFQ